jgi:peptidyl-prolyl cis-trans isomerase C
LRAASERFQRDPLGLDSRQREEVSRQARRTLELENLVLGSGEATGVVIPTEQVENAVGVLRARYPDDTAFCLDLERNGLTLAALGLALRRELIFDAVMRRVAARHAPVEEIDARLYYELHRERLSRPERRTARHLLITLNEAYPENQRPAALARIEHLADQLRGPGMLPALPTWPRPIPNAPRPWSRASWARSRAASSIPSWKRFSLASRRVILAGPWRPNWGSI